MEPERRIEKLLRAYANRRRREGGPPPELNPVTRRLLQSEIARRAAASRDPGAPPGWLNFLRVKWWWTLAGATAVVLLGTWFIYSLAQPGKTESLAAARRLEPSAVQVPETGAEQKKAAPAVVPATPAQDKLMRAVPPSIERAKSATPATASEPANTPAVAPTHATTISSGAVVATTPPPPALQRSAGSLAEPSSTLTSAANPSLKTDTRKQAESTTPPPMFDRAANPVPGAAAPTVTLADNLGVAPPGVVSANAIKDTGATASSAIPTVSAAAPTLALSNTAETPGAASLSGALAETPAANQQRFYRTGPAPSRRAGGGFGGGGGGFGGRGVFNDGTAGPPAAAGNAPGINVVLTNFVAVRSSNLLQIFDADGSIYQGYVQGDTLNAADASNAANSINPGNSVNSANAANPANSVNSVNAAPIDTAGARALYFRAQAAPNNSVPQSDTQPFAGYAFTVNGTNVTLNRMVNFSGAFVPQPAGTTINPAFYNRTLKPSGAAAQTVAYPAVSGVLTIDGETPVRIDAISVPPKN